MIAHQTEAGAIALNIADAADPRAPAAVIKASVAVFSRPAGIPAVTEAEINPLIVMPEGQGVMMADALLVVS